MIILKVTTLDSRNSEILHFDTEKDFYSFDPPAFVDFASFFWIRIKNFVIEEFLGSKWVEIIHDYGNAPALQKSPKRVNQDNYPNVTKRGLKINRPTPTTVPGILREELKRVLTPTEWKRWVKWSDGSTLSENGSYPWDVENFLAGRQNTD